MKKSDRYYLSSELWIVATLVAPDALSFVVAAVVALAYVLLLASRKEDA